MKEYCRENDLPLYECGVLVVARSPEEERRLADLQERAEANGVDTELLDEASLREREPHAAGRAALYCADAASVDSQQYVYSLAGDAKNAGADFYMGHRVTDARRTDGGLELETDKGALTARFLVNAAGLYADELANALGVGGGYRIVPFRGEYYELTPDRRDLVNSMIYPTPDPELPFLGVHYTRRADGKVIVGPNAVLAFGREAYRNTEFDLRELAETLSYRGFWKLLADRAMIRVAWEELNKSYRKDRFVEAARRLLPAARTEDFVRSYAGVRAQLVSGDGELVMDPRIVEAERSVHVLNAASPGLTSSLPFGERVAETVLESF
jgi:L-2-hydroxyglutarate oxidase LhgO